VLYGRELCLRCTEFVEWLSAQLALHGQEKSYPSHPKNEWYEEAKIEKQKLKLNKIENFKEITMLKSK
jgi:hypothetical protein